MDSFLYFSRPANMKCHNHCTINKSPEGTNALLGLGLNFCIKQPKPTNDIEKTITRFEDDVRRIWFFKFGDGQTPNKSNNTFQDSTSVVIGSHRKPIRTPKQYSTTLQVNCGVKQRNIKSVPPPTCQHTSNN